MCRKIVVLRRTSRIIYSFMYNFSLQRLMFYNFEDLYYIFFLPIGFIYGHILLTSWRRKWQPTPIFLPGEAHGQRTLVGYSPWGSKELDTTEQLTLIQRTLRNKKF